MIRASNEQERIRRIEAHYRSEKHDLGQDFFIPCLAAFSLYRRAAGFFSSSALRTWVTCLPRVAADSQTKIQLLISPEISKIDFQCLQSTIDEQERKRIFQKSADEFIREVVTFSAMGHSRNEVSLRAKLLAWLIVTGKLEIRFAINLHDETEQGVFHKKIGIFEYPWGDTIAFTGSANESRMAHNINSESVDVYRSWIDSELPRVQTKIEEFQEAWESECDNLIILTISSGTLQYIKEIAPPMAPSLGRGFENTDWEEDEKPLWPHQTEAIRAFLKVGHGILEMATGTGKTRTGLEIASSLRTAGKIDYMIVTMEGVDLLKQWFDDLLSWALPNGFTKCYRHFGGISERDSFLLQPSDSILLCSRGVLPFVFKELSRATISKRGLIIHDEVHDLGSPSCIASLGGGSDLFPFRLGMSATPEREYDQVGNDFVAKEIGDTVYRFELRDAIMARVLSPLDYEWIPYSLSAADKLELARIHARHAALKKAGTPLPKEALWMDLARVYKHARDKISRFEVFLQAKTPEYLERTLIFVEDKAFADALYEIVHSKTPHYSAYYAEDDSKILARFIAGDLECLITCHKLSQGIDVRSVRKIILFSSARSKLETIQRLGRCLRVDPKNPTKIATVVDFVLVNPKGQVSPSGMDYDRYKWLTALAKIRPL